MSPEKVKRAVGIPLAIALLALPFAPTAHGATRQLPVGEAQGVRFERSGQSLVLVFTRRAEALRRRLAGRLVSIECVDEPDDVWDRTGGGGGPNVRVPRTRRRVEVGRGRSDADYCRVRAPIRARDLHGGSRIDDRRTFVSIPRTQLGAIFLDEEEKASALAFVMFLADEMAARSRPRGFPAPARLVERMHARFARIPVAALAAPGDVPPAVAVGYYSDGDRHMAVSTLAATGRRLFVEIVLGDDVLHTNVGQHLFDSW